MQAAGGCGGRAVEGCARAVQLEARALAAPGVGEGGELGVGEVVGGELEACEGGALAGGGEHGLEAAGGLGEDELLDGEVAVDGGLWRRAHAGRAHAADDVAGEVEGGEGRAAAAVVEQGGRAEEAEVVVREEELGEAAVVLERLAERLGAVVVDAVAGEVEEDEAAEREGARVVDGAAVRDVVVVEAEALEAGAAAEAVGEGVRVVGAHAVGQVEGAQGGAGAEERGEVLDAVQGEVVLREVEVRERAEGVEAEGELVEVGAAGAFGSLS